MKVGIIFSFWQILNPKKYNRGKTRKILNETK